MGHINIEIKARSSNHEEIREILGQKGAEFKGLDHQVDTYFRVPQGRLKLRKGDIENYLVYYERENARGPKKSQVVLFKTNQASNLEEILKKSLGVLIEVDKKREIYFIDNVKIHLDNVSGLGDFIEIEAMDEGGIIGKENLLNQCRYYMGLFSINEKDLIEESYSDLVLRQK
jgi:predicted adenylyl cyclase CyaB